MQLIFGLAGLPSGQAALLTLAALTVAGLLMLAGSRAAAALASGRDRVRPARTRTILRQRTLRTAFLRLRDPDAAGRPRPRAPSPA